MAIYEKWAEPSPYDTYGTKSAQPTIINDMRMKIKELDFVFTPKEINIDRIAHNDSFTLGIELYVDEDSTPSLDKMMDLPKATLLLRARGNLRVKFHVGYPSEMKTEASADGILTVFIKYERITQEIITNGITV